MVPEHDADAIVVGAGPGGSAAAYHLARHGAQVLLLEKSQFPREKVCGDGLTPRSVAQLIRMGVDLDDPGWVRNEGLRVIGGGVRMELKWPELASFPEFGLTRTRHDFDDILAQRAVSAGADLRTGHTVTGPILDDQSGRVMGVTVKADGELREFRAPVVIAADGVSGRLPLALGLTKRDDRPLGVAVRRYYRSPVKHQDNYLESWLELRSSSRPEVLLPGYGWIFGMGDGRVNVGLGILNSSGAFGKTDYRRLLVDWLGATPADWGLGEEENAEGSIKGAALPMGFNRVPHYTRGVMLVGDTGGMVNPFNGEGIAYAMESGEIAAEVVNQALARRNPAEVERALQQYPQLLKARFGGYFRLGGIFVKLIGYPPVMRAATRHGLPHPMLMRFVLKLMANLTDPRGGDAMDRLINGMVRVAPAV
ncbi:geranylgeranyl reductase family protein [Natronosporangium hydrolyticum]|uniref:Geranylgeranyl reductase family protein n=1 Tax=Natronosporangium hydrolyticum TaxID=2811111 RepID=A0A895YFV2_9ACTN|nr:geranylgeranyl reductase family protein [Natronosporangium hydrolyticum]QSB14349.1 geranylgeranyl reductase family protein [Natronosporangium hydrolyticum]